MRIYHTFTQGLGRAAVGLAAAFALSAGLALLPAGSANAQSPNADLAFDLEDMRFILQQIEFAERHAAGEDLLDILPNASFPLGLRTVDGKFNNLIPGQESFGQSSQEFPVTTLRDFREAQSGTSYDSATNVTDSTTRHGQALVNVFEELS